jgi:hypothetical protein
MILRDNLPSKSGFIETKNLIAVIYLNTLLKGFLNSSETWQTIENSHLQTKSFFESF